MSPDATDDENADCTAVLFRIFEYLDGEMTAEDTRRIATHLEECGPCLREHDLDLALKELVRRSCQRERAPMQLRAQIMRRISAIQIQSGQ